MDGAACQHDKIDRVKKRAGFTLIELMIVVAILGILASLSIPVFRTLLLRSKTSEATTNLSVLFKHASSYYAAERTDSQGQNAALQWGCTVGEFDPPAPTAQKRPLSDSPEFRALGFSLADYLYYAYGIAPEGTDSICGNPASDPTVYTLYAHGDLDDDNTYSTFELAVGSDGQNELYHARGLFIENELE